MWSCVNCRRRKVRCDRRYPCAPCTKNRTDCVFPLAGRLPRRSRDANHPNHTAHSQKQAELLGRLRRLEAMVGDLGSQVEHVAVVNQGDPPGQSSMNATSATSSETGWPDHRSTLHSQFAIGDSFTSRDGVQVGSGMAQGSSESSQTSDRLEGLTVATNGDIVVHDRFWTVFCKEVCSSSASVCLSQPTGLELWLCG